MSKILVVDDSMTVRQQVSAALGPAGFAIVEAKDGVEGLEKIEGDKEVKVVICDINMPRMNGLDMLEEARRRAGNQNLPFLMLTTEAQPDMVARAKAAGAKGWMVKPFKPDVLLQCIKKLAA
jgi:two-component system chemotaxis response regulator CheY